MQQYHVFEYLLSKINCWNTYIGVATAHIYVSARSSKLPVGERYVPVCEQSSQGVGLRTGTFPFANGLVCEKNSFLFTLPTLSRGFHRYPVITNGQVPVDERDSTQWQTEEY